MALNVSAHGSGRFEKLGLFHVKAKLHRVSVRRDDWADRADKAVPLTVRVRIDERNELCLALGRGMACNDVRRLLHNELIVPLQAIINNPCPKIADTQKRAVVVLKVQSIVVVAYT